MSTLVGANHHPSTAPMPERTIHITLTHHQSDSPMDRDSAIALGVILFLILLTIAWYVRLRLKQRRQGDEERLTVSAHRNSIEALRRYGGRARASDPVFRTERLWRRASEMTALSGMGKEKGKMGSWSSSRDSSSVSSEETRVGSVALEEAGGRHQEDTRSRSPSPHSVTTPPPRSNHRRKSSVHDIPDVFLAELQLQRPSATQVARRGSAVQVDRRFSVLESIPEPEEVVVKQTGRRRSEAEWRGERSRARGRSIRGQDWTMPVAGGTETVDQGRESNQGASCDQFKSIVWADQCSGPKMNENADVSQMGIYTKRDGVERVDWAAISPPSMSVTCSSSDKKDGLENTERKHM